jgi:hypothetical protein
MQFLTKSETQISLKSLKFPVDFENCHGLRDLYREVDREPDWTDEFISSVLAAKEIGKIFEGKKFTLLVFLSAGEIPFYEDRNLFDQFCLSLGASEIFTKIRGCKFAEYDIFHLLSFINILLLNRSSFLLCSHVTSPFYLGKPNKFKKFIERPMLSADNDAV